MAAGVTAWDATMCPDAETLAAFLDNRLVEREREIMASHLASCEACYFTFTEAARMQIRSGDVAATASWWTRRRVIEVAAGLAVAASLAVAVAIGVMPWQRSQPQLDGLIAAVGSSRLIEPRITAGFAYAPLPGATRSGQPQMLTATPDVRIEAARIDKATEADDSPAALHARAIAALMIGDIDSGVFALEQAVARQPADARLSSDLAAAYLARGRRQGDRTDFSKALAAANRAVELAPQMPEALFNRALAIERIGSADEARAAWQRYLESDSQSGWADEARARLRDR